MTDKTRTIDTTRRMIVLGVPTLAAAASLPAWAQSKEDFHIGAIGSLSGPAAPYGKDYSDGFLTYTREWNKRGGYNGRKIVVEMLDDETNAVNAVNLYRKLASDPKVMVIWAAIGSQTAMGIKSIAGEFKVPVISGGGIDALGIPAEPWFFKISVGTSDLSRAVIEGVKKKGYKTIAMLNATDAYGQGEAAFMKKLAADAGIKVVAAETFATTDTNFASQFVRIRSADPQFLYNGATGAPAILVFNQYQQLGLKFPMAMSFAAFSGAFFKGIGGIEKANGVLSAIPIGAIAAGAPGELGRLYKECSDALGKPALVFHTVGWDTGMLTEGVLKVSDGTRAGIRDALDKVKDLPAINGPFTYTPDNHIGQDIRGLALAQLNNGKWAPA